LTSVCFFSSLLPLPSIFTLFPYTTLFRSPNELNQDDARYGFRCCHLKNIWTAPLPPETELSRQMTTSTTSIDIMGLQAQSQEEADRKSGSAGMPRPISYAVFCLKKKTLPSSSSSSPTAMFSA